MSDNRCADCGQPVTKQHPGRCWGIDRWCHNSKSICIAAIGAAVNRLERGTRQDGGE